jgi:hypothetical protein
MDFIDRDGSASSDGKLNGGRAELRSVWSGVFSLKDFRPTLDPFRVVENRGNNDV